MTKGPTETDLYSGAGGGDPRGFKWVNIDEAEADTYLYITITMMHDA